MPLVFLSTFKIGWIRLILWAKLDFSGLPFRKNFPRDHLGSIKVIYISAFGSRSLREFVDLGETWENHIYLNAQALPDTATYIMRYVLHLYIKSIYMHIVIYQFLFLSSFDLAGKLPDRAILNLRHWHWYKGGPWAKFARKPWLESQKSKKPTHRIISFGSYKLCHLEIGPKLELCSKGITYFPKLLK